MLQTCWMFFNLLWSSFMMIYYNLFQFVLNFLQSEGNKRTFGMQTIK